MKKIIWIVLALALVAGASYFYVFHKPHRNIHKEKAAFDLSAEALKTAYASNVETANALYLDQVVKVSGKVIKKDGSNLKLDQGIYCTMAEGYEPSTGMEGMKVVVKGRVVGYDELFEEVKMDNCELVQ